MLARMLGAARLNVDTYEDVEKDKGATIQALIVVILVAISAGVGGLLSDEGDLVRGLAFGAIRGVLSWAVWALVAWIVGTTLLKTQETEADWGQLARGTGFAPNPRSAERIFVCSGRWRAHRIFGIPLAVGLHGSCRTAEPGLHVNSAGDIRDPHRLHPCNNH